MKIIKISPTFLLSLALAVAGIENAIEVRIGAGWQLWMFPLALLSINYFLSEKNPFIIKKQGLFFFLLLVLAITSSLFGLFFTDYPPLSETVFRQIVSHEARIIVSNIRFVVCIVGILLMLHYSKKYPLWPQKGLLTFLKGGSLVAIYGLYEFILSLLDAKLYLLPGSWGTINTVRSASLFYEPSQFGFFCVVLLLLSMWMSDLNMLTRKQKILFPLVFILGLCSSVSGSGLYSLILGITAGSLVSYSYFKKWLKLSTLIIFPVVYVLLPYIAAFEKYALAWKHKYYQAIRYDYFDSAQSRVVSQISSWDRFLDVNPIMGTGLGTNLFYVSGQKFYDKYFFEFGLIGIVLLIVFVFTVMAHLIRFRKNQKQYFGHHIAITICFFSGLFNYSAIEHFWLWYIFYMLIFGLYHPSFYLNKVRKRNFTRAYNT